MLAPLPHARLIEHRTDKRPSKYSYERKEYVLVVRGLADTSWADTNVRIPSAAQGTNGECSLMQC